MMVPTLRAAARLALAALAAALAPAAAGAQGVATGVIAGVVTIRGDSAESAERLAPPLGQATVTFGGGPRARAAFTDVLGRFIIADAPAGEGMLVVRRLGYRTAQRTVTVVAGDTIRVAIALEREVQTLPGVRTDATAAGMESFTARPNVGTLAMPARAMVGVPSVGEPDVVRVVQLLPGVQARNDFSTGLNVRGGSADQNLVLLDGIPIYNPFHLGGLFSTFIDATVGGIELMTGAFPSRYDGRLSSVLDVRSADEERRGVHATVDASLLAATGRASGTVGSRGSWSLAARRTYADAVASAFSEDAFPYHFRDLHARASWLLPGDVRLSATAYAGRDVLNLDLAGFASDTTVARAGEGRWAYDWGNRALGATLSKDFAPSRGLGWLLGDGATVEQRVSASGFSTRLDVGDGAKTQKSAIRDVRAAGSFTARGAAHDRSIGYEVAAYGVRYASRSAATGTVDYDIAQRPVSAAAWIDDLWRVSPRWLVEGGVRGETLTGTGWSFVSPRLSVKYFATPNVALTAAAGRVSQYVHSLAGDSPFRFFDVWLASDDYIPVESAWHWVAGAERRVTRGSLRVEGWVKRYDQVLDAVLADDPSRRGDEFLPATGLAYGADLLARWQPSAGPTGWVSYSYGVSERERGGVRWAPGNDRRHDLNVVATWRRGRYQWGARFGYASGTPYTPIVGEIVRRVYDPTTGTWGTGNPQTFVEPLAGAHNSARLPAAHRLDVHVAREMVWRGATWAPYASVVNAYDAKNIFVYVYDYSTSRPTRRAYRQFPILPSVGVRVAF